jgi:hypothetical protein
LLIFDFLLKFLIVARFPPKSWTLYFYCFVFWDKVGDYFFFIGDEISILMIFWSVVVGIPDYGLVDYLIYKFFIALFA